MHAHINAGLIGNGKMGREIASHAAGSGVRIVHTFDSRSNVNGSGIRNLKPGSVDVLIEFTAPGEVLGNIRAAAERNLPIVTGTTGWYSDLDKAAEIVRSAGTGLLYSPNFSIGVNVLFELVKTATALFDGFPEYDVYIHESHHTGKLDSPSGTAAVLGSHILSISSRKTKIETGKPKGKIEPEVLHISSTRAGSIVGTHVTGFDSEIDSLEIKHTAKTRAGFAIGALRAAKWIVGKQGIYTMADLLKST